MYTLGMRGVHDSGIEGVKDGKEAVTLVERIISDQRGLFDFKTVGRSEEWKQNVLRNAAIKEIDLPKLQPGKHTLTIYSIDPGVVLDGAGI